MTTTAAAAAAGGTPPPPPPQQTSTLTQDLTLPGGSPLHTTTTTPRLVYGTAWKKDRTADLVYRALKSGFRGIDTAAQPRHYQERLVGDGLRRAVAEGLVTRDAIYLQTKFTSVDGQDRDDLPYDPAAPLEEQVRASVESSLRNLATVPSSSTTSSSSGTDNVNDNDNTSTSTSPYLDCLVLHSPLPTLKDTLTVWRALEAYVPHQIRHLGIANAPPDVVRYLLSTPHEGHAAEEPPAAAAVRVPPSVVQNRFHETTGWEGDLRRLCRDRGGVVFQTFWTLTGNPRLVRKSAPVGDLADRTGTSREVAFYALVLGLRGTSILDGTSDAEHMRADLDGVEHIGRWADGEGKEAWEAALAAFKGLIGEEE